VIFIDPDGRAAGWYDDGSGTPQFNKNIHSQADLKKKGINGNYLGEKGKGINPVTGRAVTQYNADGTKTPIPTTLPTAEVQANDPYPYSRILTGDAGDYGPWTGPDFVGVGVSYDAMFGGGTGADLTLLGQTNNGDIFSNISSKIGSGWDNGFQLNLNFAIYTGNDAPTAKSLAGPSVFQSVSFGPLTFATWQDISTSIISKKPQIGHNWRGFSIGLGLPSSLFSFGTSYTSNPLMLNKK
jgi:hypothetical protein